MRVFRNFSTLVFFAVDLSIADLQNSRCNDLRLSGSSYS